MSGFKRCSDKQALETDGPSVMAHQRWASIATGVKRDIHFFRNVYMDFAVFFFLKYSCDLKIKTCIRCDTRFSNWSFFQISEFTGAFYFFSNFWIYWGFLAFIQISELTGAFFKFQNLLGLFSLFFKFQS